VSFFKDCQTGLVLLKLKLGVFPLLAGLKSQLESFFLVFLLVSVKGKLYFLKLGEHFLNGWLCIGVSTLIPILGKIQYSYHKYLPTYLPTYLHDLQFGEVCNTVMNVIASYTQTRFRIISTKLLRATLDEGPRSNEIGQSYWLRVINWTHGQKVVNRG